MQRYCEGAEKNSLPCRFYALLITPVTARYGYGFLSISMLKAVLLVFLLILIASTLYTLKKNKSMSVSTGIEQTDVSNCFFCNLLGDFHYSMMTKTLRALLLKHTILYTNVY